MQEKLTINYTNDLHSHFENWPKIAGYFKQNKQEVTDSGETCWLIDIGDHVDRSRPIAEAFRGKANVSLLNEAGFDFATIGNNEGITLDHDDLYHLYDEAEFRVAVANLHAQENDDPSWLESSWISETSGGLKVGMIGLTAPFPDFYSLIGWDIEDPIDVLRRELGQLREACDVVVLLSHLGIYADRDIAAAFPDIDVIIGGHTHHLLHEGEYVNQCLITTAGKQGFYFGEVEIIWDHEQKCIVDKRAMAIPVAGLDDDPGTAELVALYSENAVKAMHRPAVVLPDPMPSAPYEDSRVMDRLTDYLRRWTSADLAFLNAGVLLDSFPEGAISYMDIHRICPHPINPATVPLTGEELQQIVDAALQPDFVSFQLKGFGFRGKVIGKMVYSGLTFDLAGTKAKPRAVNLMIHGEPLQRDEQYLTAMADTFTFGDLLPCIKQAKSKKYFMPEMLRDLLLQTFKEIEK
ncbi:bifunctional UDP-sugar hydrolase/5'-nucleotidase [Terribacillus saccharophilus]|uniref:bifunctional metallophosphatase/5'-nucleotidase n=1 Tax=Terribacillus saccharophilus TaxID=361277 RepID=UPI003981DDBE